MKLGKEVITTKARGCPLRIATTLGYGKHCIPTLLPGWGEISYRNTM